MVAFNLNGAPVSAEAPPDTPILWVIREHLGLTGTKFGCGAGLCGACTVHSNGKAIRACLTPLANVAGASITTIEGLSDDGNHALQKAWIAEQVPQCGYCQSGQIMQAATLLANNPNPTRAEIISHMDGNICRCGTYTRIIAAIQRASREGLILMDCIEDTAPYLTRRGFLASVNGLAFVIGVGPNGVSLVTTASAAARQRPFGVWVRIAPDDRITIVTPAAEMGQGSMTGVPIPLAEELDADWSKVTLEMAPAEPETYGYNSHGGRRSMGIYGSRATMMYFDQMRVAGAQVRKILLQAAAEKWQVEVGELTTEPSIVVHQTLFTAYELWRDRKFCQQPCNHT